MGKDIHVRIIQLDTYSNQYKQIVLYRKNQENKMVPADIYPGRYYELFDILNGNTDFNFPRKPINTENLPVELKEEIKICKEDFGYYDFNETTLADLKVYLSQNPKVRDYDWEDEDTFEKEGWKDNPVKDFVDTIINYVSIADYWWLGTHLNSDIRILYWFDC